MPWNTKREKFNQGIFHLQPMLLPLEASVSESQRFAYTIVDIYLVEKRNSQLTAHMYARSKYYEQGLTSSHDKLWTWDSDMSWDIHTLPFIKIIQVAVLVVVPRLPIERWRRITFAVTPLRCVKYCTYWYHIFPSSEPLGAIISLGLETSWGYRTNS